MSESLHAFLVCVSAVLAVTAVLHIILLIRFDSLSSSSNAAAIGYTALVIGGALVALSTVLILLHTRTRVRPTAAASSNRPVERATATVTSSGLRIATRVDPKSTIAGATPARRGTWASRRAGVLQQARRSPPPTAPAPAPTAGQPATPSRPTATPSPVTSKAVSPRSAAGLHAPSRPVPPAARAAAPTIGKPPASRARRTPGHPHAHGKPVPQAHLPMEWVGTPPSPTLVDRLLGRVPHPTPHPWISHPFTIWPPAVNRGLSA